MDKRSKRPMIQRILAVVAAVILGITCFTSGDYKNLMGLFGVDETSNVVAHAEERTEYVYDAGTMTLNGQKNPDGIEHTTTWLSPENWKVTNLTSTVTDNSGATLPESIGNNEDLLTNMSCLSHVLTPEGNIVTPGNTTNMEITDYSAGIPTGIVYCYVAKGTISYNSEVETHPVSWVIYAWPKGQAFSSNQVLDTRGKAEAAYLGVLKDVADELSSTIIEPDSINERSSDFGLARPIWESHNVKYNQWYDQSKLGSSGYYDSTEDLKESIKAGRNLLWNSALSTKPWIEIGWNDSKTQVQAYAHNKLSAADSIYGRHGGATSGSDEVNDATKYLVYGLSDGAPADNNIKHGDVVGTILNMASNTASDFGYVPQDNVTSLPNNLVSSKWQYNNLKDNTKGTVGTVKYLWNGTKAVPDGTLKYVDPEASDDVVVTRNVRDWSGNSLDEDGTVKTEQKYIDDTEYNTRATVVSAGTQLKTYYNTKYSGTWPSSRHYVDSSKKVVGFRDYGFWVTSTNGTSSVYSAVFNATTAQANKDAYNNKIVTGHTQANVTPIFDVTYDYQRSLGTVDGTVTFNKPRLISTLAVDKTTRTHVGVVSNSSTIVDSVNYTSLNIDGEYTLKGYVYQLMDGGIDKTHPVATSTTNFQAKAKSGTAAVEFTFDSTKYAGKTLVVYEELYLTSAQSMTLATHESYDDPLQQVSYVDIYTEALMKSTNLHRTEPIVGDTIRDTVELRGIRYNESYMLESKIYNDTDKNFVSTGNGAITLVKNFYIDKDGHVQKSSSDTSAVENVEIKMDEGNKPMAVVYVDFEDLDLTSYTGDDLVVYQYLYSIEANSATDSNKEHKVNYAAENMTGDASSEETLKGKETIHVTSPTVSTILTDNGTLSGSHNISVSDTTELIDKVTYDGLAGSSVSGGGTPVYYLAKSWLVDDTGTAIAAAGEHKKILYGSSGSTQTFPVEFDAFDSHDYDNKYVVAFNELYRLLPDAGGQSYSDLGLTGTFKAYPVVSEKDLENKNQTVYFPGDAKLSTKVTLNGTSGPAKIVAEDVIMATDTVYYVGLKTTDNYVIKTTMCDLGIKNKDGNYEDGTGMLSDVSVTTSLTPTSPTGSVPVQLKFNGSALSGHTLVVYEELFAADGTTPILNKEGKPVVHKDNTDTLQQIIVEKPVLTTIATGTVTESHELECAKDAQITDKVSYTGLVSGKAYTLTSQVYDKDTGKVISGFTPVKTNFTAAASAGQVTVNLKVNSLAYHGKKLVVVQTLSYGQNGAELVVHKDMNDEDQTVTVDQPTLTTMATYGETERHQVPCSASVTISDEITYSHLQPGTSYTITTTFYDKKTKKPVRVDGSALKATTTTFKADNSAGKTTVDVTLDTTRLAGKTLVVYETFAVDNVVVGSHEDINDENQTITVTEPKISTVATNSGSDSHTIPFTTKAIVDDTVKLQNLEPGESYTLIATLIDKETKKPVGSNTGTNNNNNNNGSSTNVNTSNNNNNNGGNRQSTYTFKAEKAEEEHVMTINFDASAYKGKELVVYEELRIGTATIAEHKDINDKDQTVKVATPSISTVATDAYNGTHTISEPITVDMLGTMGATKTGKNGEATQAADNSSGSGMINDRVHYSGLVKGETYTLTTQVIDKATGKAINGQSSSAGSSTGSSTANSSSSSGQSTTFTAEGDSGDVDIAIPVDTQLHMGKTLVIYEELLAGKNVGATHHNINDANQTVYVGHIDTILTGMSKTNPKEVSPTKKLQLYDTVAFYGLEPGVTYTIVGTIMNADAVSGKVGTSTGNSKAFVTDRLSMPKTTTIGTGSTSSTTSSDDEEEIAVVDGDSSSSSSSSSGTNSGSTSKTTTTTTTTMTGAGNATTGTTTTTTSKSSSNGNNSVIGIVGGNNKNNSNNNSSSTDNKNGSTTGTTTSTTGDGANSSSTTDNNNTNANGANNTSQAPANGGVQTVYGTNMNPQVGTFTIAFKPTASNGIIQVPFIVDASNLQGHNLVAYEVIYRGAKPVLAHQNIADANQTVTVSDSQSSASWKTGVESHAGMLMTIATIALALAAAMVGWFAYKKKH